ncbi:hypothetical protein K474DRAFT_1710147 [Panus rudis PR-1116 ss-1]|nr:hypothetical protein K474DRAFT_1710147 [Panus rudis PR-1116 ss-1]
MAQLQDLEAAAIAKDQAISDIEASVAAKDQEILEANAATTQVTANLVHSQAQVLAVQAELEASQHQAENAIATTGAAQPGSVALIAKPKGRVQMRTLHGLLGLRTYKCIQNTIHTMLDVQDLDPFTDFRLLDAEKMSEVVNVIRTEYPTILRFANSWPVYTMSRQYRRNFRKNGIRKGYLKSPTAGNKENQPPADGNDAGGNGGAVMA